jgi:hypothetical protein
MFAKMVPLTSRTIRHEGRGGKRKNSPLSPCGRGVGGEGDYKNGMLPVLSIQNPCIQNPKLVSPLTKSGQNRD